MLWPNTQTFISDFSDQPLNDPIDLNSLRDQFKKLDIYIDREGMVRIRVPFCPHCSRRQNTHAGKVLKQTQDILNNDFYFVCQRYKCSFCEGTYSAYIKHIIVYDEEMVNEKIIMRLDDTMQDLKGKKREIHKLGEEILSLIDKFISQHIELEMSSKAQYKENDIIELVIRNSINTSFMETTRNLLDLDPSVYEHPSSDTVLLYIGKKKLQDIRTEFRMIFRHFINEYKKAGFIPGPIDIAIDFHNVEYYGKQRTGEVVRARAKNGTTYFHKYLTVDCVKDKNRFTLVGEHISQFVDHFKKCMELLDFIKTNRIEIGVAFFDREFFNAKIVNYLLDEKVKIDFVIPAKKNEKVMRLAKERWEKEEFVFNYHFGKGKNKSSEFTIFLIANRDYDPSKRPGKGNQEFYTFATNLKIRKSDHSITSKISDDKDDGYYRKDISSMYKTRWGIETDYRVLDHEFWGKTTSNKFNIRYFYAMMGMVLRNVWEFSKTSLKPLYQGKFPKNSMTAKLWSRVLERTLDRKKSESAMKSIFLNPPRMKATRG